MRSEPQPSAELVREGFDPRVVMPEIRPGMPLVIGEAPGKTEAETGVPFHPEAEAGGLFTRLLQRVGVTRERFSIVNTVWQRPPANELYYDDGEPKDYTEDAINYWKPYLHELIEELKPPVIIGLGRTALSVLTGFSNINTTRGYINMASVECKAGRVPCECVKDGNGVADPSCFLCNGTGSYQDAYERVSLNIPTLCTYHPQFLNYGNRHLSGVFIRDVLEGLDIASKGWKPPKLNVTPNPTVEQFRWFCQQYNPERHVLTYDIENPETRGVDEDVLEAEEGKKEISYVIDRMSFCFDTGIGGWSVPYVEPYISLAKQLLASAGTKRGHNCRLHDRPRLVRNGFEVAGREEDTLELWRHLHRTLPASIAYIAPFYLSMSPWKYEAHTQPEWYSAMDAIVQHLCGEGIERDLRATGQWEVTQRHVVDVLALTEKMAQNGLPYDVERAKQFDAELAAKHKKRLARLQQLVPEHIKPVKQKKGLKRVPKDLTGYVEREFTLWEKNEAGGVLPRKERRYALLQPFNPNSPPQKKALIQHFGHKLKTNRKTKEATTAEGTLKALIVQCLKSTKPSDVIALECYQLIRDCVILSKVRGMIKGWKPGADGLIHATPYLTGKMFRLSWRRPPLSATIADKKEVQIAAGFRQSIACPPGEVLIESDWISQEAVILGYYAKSPEYMRIARLSLNAYMTSHLLGRPADLTWSDKQLAGYLKEIKDDPKNTKIYDDAKHTIYLIQNGGTPYLISETYELTMERATFLYNFYFELFPAIRAFHKHVLDTAWEKCKLTNPWMYTMPIWSAYQWEQSRFDRLRKLWVRYKTQPKAKFSTRELKDLERIELVGGEERIASLCYDLGTEAKAAMSFFPRDTGSAMLKDSLLELEDKYRLGSGGVLRATAHDSIISICKWKEAEQVAEWKREVQEQPWPRLDGLVIGVDQKFGTCWDKRSLSSRLPVEVAHA